MSDIAISAAQRLMEAIGSEIITKFCDLWNYKSELEQLKETVSTITMVLLDADAKQDQLSNQDRDYINKLKDVVYDADDVFDEFRTLAELNQLHGGLRKHRFFFFKNQVSEAYRISCEVKEIKKRLDDIAVNREKFKLDVDHMPIRRRREETCSYVDSNRIIGRDADKEAIVKKLLDPSVPEDVCFMAIVGVGGLGKTALTQLVFNDENIKQNFPVKLWVCVSDQDGEQFEAKAILCKILEVATGEKVDGTSTMELVKNKFEENLKGKKYFLVLDDVWTEERGKWLALKDFLMMGQGGSRIVVTTRSMRTSAIIGDGDDHAYELQDLSKEDSWQLFEMSAFTRGIREESNDGFVEIGRKIVEKCYCIPLAIKVVGSLLFGQHITKWRSLERSGLMNIDNGDNGILPVLKLSYHNLEPSLKSCFSYCAVFPKDFRIYKAKIISLWLAQGYVVPLDGGQSLEDAAEEHFLMLLRRCFFQDVQRDEYGDVIYFKIHDLMHDVAQEVGGREQGRIQKVKTGGAPTKRKKFRKIL